MISGGGSSNFANTCSKMALWTLDQCTDYEHSKTIMVKHTLKFWNKSWNKSQLEHTFFIQEQTFWNESQLDKNATLPVMKAISITHSSQKVNNLKHFHKKNKCKKMLNFSKFLIFASVSLAIMKLQNLGNWGIQRSIQNPKHLRWSISWKVVNYFCKTLHLRFLAGFWIHLRNHLSHRTSTVQKQLFPDVL